MLHITIPENNQKERAYILDVIFNVFLGISYNLKVDNDLQNYLIQIENGNQLIIQDHFFSKYKKELEYLSIKNLPGTIQFAHNDFLPENDIPVLFGTSHLSIEKVSSGKTRITCGIDIFASAFLMLTRWEEYVNEEKDKLNRFSGRSSVAFKKNFLHRPVVNEYVEFLWNLLDYLNIDQQRKQRKFEPYLTHDVDFILKWYSIYTFLHALAGDLLTRRSLKAFFGNINDFLKTKRRRKNDPFDTFDYLMDLSEKNGLKSYFFFISKPQEKGPVNYKLSHPYIKVLMEKIVSRGHYIGFHPGHNTANNPANWSDELEKLKKYSPREVLFGRQHFLHFKAPVTWQIWNDMGMEWDSSLSYHDEPGFRTGSCYSYPVFNFLTQEKLKLIEKPLTIMDKSLVFHHIHLSVPQMIEKALELVNTVKKYNGEFILLWHNSCFDVYEWRKYKSIYTEIIKSFSR
jgi:hypothetical protein